MDSNWKVAHGHLDVSAKLKPVRTVGLRSYELSDHLGNVLATVLDRKTGVPGYVGSSTYISWKADVGSLTDYYPFGMVMPGRSYERGAGSKFGFNGQLKSDEVYGKGNLNTALFWEYDTRISRRWNTDPVVHEWESAYSTFGDNPIRNKDINGDSWWDETKFALRHHGIANRIGQFSRGSTNISTNAVRFATRGNILNEHSGAEANMGSQVNAVRHTLWQATIASKWGGAIAREAGDAHEDDAEAIAGRSETQLRMSTFKTMEDADQTVDLLNNIIGRRIGQANRGAGMKDLAQKVADQFHDEGLWTVVRQGSDGTFKIIRGGITDGQHNALKSTYRGLNNDGFTAAEQKEREENAKAGEEAQRKINTTRGPKI